MIVYRVETVGGLGPYVCGAVPAAWYNPLRQPAPLAEKGTEMQREFPIWTKLPARFGFASLADLRRWFNPAQLVLMAEAGCVIRSYRAVRLWRGRCQVVFICSAPEPVREARIPDRWTHEPDVWDHETSEYIYDRDGRVVPRPCRT